MKQVQNQNESELESSMHRPPIFDEPAAREDLKISLIIPIYNEGKHLERFLKWIDEAELPIKKELVIIDDCSKDDSYLIAKNFEFSSDVKLIAQERNQGKGAAIRRGLNEASGDIICVQDADFEYDVKDLPKLLEPLLEGQADVVYGSRFQRGGGQVHRTFHYLVNRFLTMLSNLLSGLYLSDMETCYKLFRAEIIKNVNLESNRFGFEPEVTAKIARLKIRVSELPVSYFPRNYIEGKKITWKDGLAALKHIFVYNCVANKKLFFKDTLPEKYIPQGGNWL